MYSYGSSARVGSKQGHGGRNYRPPPERKDPKSTPPPLKLCDCLIELDVPEYATPQPQGRAHTSFGGRQQVDACIRTIRLTHCCHLEIPGRTKGGPVGVVGETVQDAVPACHHLLQRLAVNQIRARIHRNVKLCQIPVEGTFFKLEEEIGCLFESNNFCIAACHADSPSKMKTLESCLENLQFRDGQYGLEICTSQETVFAAGPQDQINLLLEEIRRVMSSDGA